ncbi:hypothetical protein LVD17_28100 [Fulvivirga ulvae]|uniref:hypothetical protein n=1 Tax=Fulvivirga ulvae TaxID=2904245 RepID=UPI001F42E3DD|nr:hypothetical protein [Fulvivirga ulvae]UII32151.1 hypothetical protein LVD17_28100 [Fulvivirga ulvae]
MPNKNTLEKAFAPINLTTANEIIGTYKAIKTKMAMSFLELPDGLSREDLVTFKKDINDFNGFLFEKDEILKMLRPGVTHLIVVLGAHPKVDPQYSQFGKGSFTVVVAGCTSDTPVGVKSDEYVAVEPASEYPPRAVVSKLKRVEGLKSRDGAVEKLVFKVKK